MWAISNNRFKSKDCAAAAFLVLVWNNVHVGCQLVPVGQDDPEKVLIKKFGALAVPNPQTDLGPGLPEIPPCNMLGEPGHSEVGVRNPDQEHFLIDGDNDLKLADGIPGHESSGVLPGDGLLVLAHSRGQDVKYR